VQNLSYRIGSSGANFVANNFFPKKRVLGQIILLFETKTFTTRHRQRAMTGCSQRGSLVVVAAVACCGPGVLSSTVDRLRRKKCAGRCGDTITEPRAKE